MIFVYHSSNKLTQPHLSWRKSLKSVKSLKTRPETWNCTITIKKQQIQWDFLGYVYTIPVHVHRQLCNIFVLIAWTLLTSRISILVSGFSMCSWEERQVYWIWSWQIGSGLQHTAALVHGKVLSLPLLQEGIVSVSILGSRVIKKFVFFQLSCHASIQPRLYCRKIMLLKVSTLRHLNYWQHQPKFLHQFWRSKFRIARRMQARSQKKCCNPALF